MTTYNTGNPVPSADARDRYDNSQTLDEVVNGDSASYATRTGKQVISLGGMNSRFNNAQDARESAFNLSQEEKQEAFQSFLDGTGWSSIGAYGAGVVITSHTQTVDYLGQPYALKPSIPASLTTPYVTTGVWATEGAKFKLVGDNSLRQDLAATDGAALAGYKGRTVYQRLSDVVSVKDFGAVGDGIADDYPAFHAAANSFPEFSSCEVIVPRGVYRLSQPWVISNRGVVISGSGPRSSVLQFYNCDGIVHRGDFTCDIRDIGLETNAKGLYAGISYGVGVSVLTRDTIRLSSVNVWGKDYATDYWETGVRIKDSGNTWLDRVTIIGQNKGGVLHGGRGVHILSSVAKPSTGHHFSRCSFNFLDIGAHITAAHYPSIEGVRFHYCGLVSVRAGVLFDATASGYKPPLFTFHESHIDLAKGAINPYGLKMLNVSQVDIKSCDLYAFTDNSVLIWLDNTEQTIIQGNHFISGSTLNSSGLLLMSGAQLTTISENQFIGGFASGILALANTGGLNKEVNNTFAGVISRVVDGAGKLIRPGLSQVTVNLSATQSIPSETPTKIAWEAAAANFSESWVSTSPTRITIKPGVESVRISAVVRFNINATGYRQLLIKKNGAFLRGLPISSVQPSASQPADLSVSSATIPVTEGDYFEIEVAQTSGAGLDLDAGVTQAQLDVVRAS